jgi:spore coat protein U-like protein
MRRASLFAAAAFALMLFPSHARACTIGTTAVAFGAYNPQGAPVTDGTGTITLACPTAVTAPVVALGAGVNGTIATRKLASGANRINYNLYTTTTRNVIWGDGTSGSVTLTFSGGVLSGGTRNFSHTVYGRIPALQNVKAGAYTDTVIVTVNF